MTGNSGRTPLPLSVTRLPAFQPGMRIGILGGSFDPPHRGHLELSLAALRMLRLDEVWWLVSPHNPLKPNAPTEDLARRVLRARQFVNNPRIKVTGIEATLGTTYTAETLRRLMPRLGGIDLVWLMGADNLSQFHRWRHWQTIAETVPMAVFNRPNEALRALASPAAQALASFRLPVREAGKLAGKPPPAWVFIGAPHVPLSSTALRALGSKGKNRVLKASP